MISQEEKWPEELARSGGDWYLARNGIGSPAFHNTGRDNEEVSLRGGSKGQKTGVLPFYFEKRPSAGPNEGC